MDKSYVPQKVYGQQLGNSKSLWTSCVPQKVYGKKLRTSKSLWTKITYLKKFMGKSYVPQKVYVVVKNSHSVDLFVVLMCVCVDHLENSSRRCVCCMFVRICKCCAPS